MQVSSTHTICARLSLTMVMFRLYTARIKAALRQTVAAISVVDGERQHCRELAPRAAAFSMPLVERSLHRSLVTLTAGHLVDDLLRLERGYHVIAGDEGVLRSEEHTSELQSLMRISYAVFCLKKKKKYKT